MHDTPMRQISYRRPVYTKYAKLCTNWGLKYTYINAQNHLKTRILALITYRGKYHQHGRWNDTAHTEPEVILDNYAMFLHRTNIREAYLEAVSLTSYYQRDRDFFR